MDIVQRSPGRRPDLMVPYHGGAVAFWMEDDITRLGVRSSYAPEQFRPMMEGVAARFGGNGPTRENYWFFHISARAEVEREIREWADSTRYTEFEPTWPKDVTFGPVAVDPS